MSNTLEGLLGSSGYNPQPEIPEKEKYIKHIVIKHVQHNNTNCYGYTMQAMMKAFNWSYIPSSEFHQNEYNV